MRLPKGAIKNVRVIVTLANNAANNDNRLTCPPHHYWWVYSIRAQNGDDVARTVTLRLYSKDGQWVRNFNEASASATNSVNIPNADDLTMLQSNLGAFPFPMDEGDYIRCDWAAGGASAGGDSEFSLRVVELPYE